MPFIGLEKILRRQDTTVTMDAVDRDDDDIVMIYGDLDSDLVKKAKSKPAQEQPQALLMENLRELAAAVLQ
jgi:hypothetical protein